MAPSKILVGPKQQLTRIKEWQLKILILDDLSLQYYLQRYVTQLSFHIFSVIYHIRQLLTHK